MIDREGVTCESGINRKDREVFYLDWKRNEINKNVIKANKNVIKLNKKRIAALIFGCCFFIPELHRGKGKKHERKSYKSCLFGSVWIFNIPSWDSGNPGRPDGVLQRD